MTSKFLLGSTACLTLLLNAPHAYATATILELGTLGGADSYLLGLTNDGKTAAGKSFNGTGDERSFYWTESGGMIDLGTLPSSNLTRMQDLSGDGSTVVGMGFLGSHYEAFYWTQNAGIISIGSHLGGNSSHAYAVNYDGSVIVGDYFNGSTYMAYRWTQNAGMQDLGFLPSGSYSTAYGVSDDGTVIAGVSTNAATYDIAFRWSQVDGMTPLGTLGGNGSLAEDISGDGLVIIGGAENSSTYTEAFRWTQLGGMVGLGTFSGLYSNATGVNYDGSIIVGSSDSGAFMWTSTDGSKLISDILTDDGIDVSAWSIDEVSYLNNDGTILGGTGVYNGNNRAFILSFAQNNSGIITPEELAVSLLPTVAPAQQSYSLVADGIGQSLWVARNSLSNYFPRSIPLSATTIDIQNPASIAPAAGGTDAVFDPYGRKRIAAYATGNLGIGQNNDYDNSTVNGTAGLLIEMNDRFVIGGGVIMGHSTEETHLDGKSEVDAMGGSLNLAYEGQAGLRLYGTVAASKLDVESKRNYLNGASVDTSSGETDGYAYGTSVRAGYEFPHEKDAISFMPYAELQYSRSQLDAYTENGGAFPADVSKQTGKTFVSLLGLEASQDITQDLTVRGRTAWGHRYTDDNTVTVTAATITQTLTGDAGDKNWAELGMTFNYKLNDKTTITGDVQGRSGKTSDPQMNVGIGLAWSFN